MSNIAEARKVVVARILEGEGRASHAQRKAAFDNAGLGEPLRTLVDKVARNARTELTTAPQKCHVFKRHHARRKKSELKFRA